MPPTPPPCSATGLIVVHVWWIMACGCIALGGLEGKMATTLGIMPYPTSFLKGGVRPFLPSNVVLLCVLLSHGLPVATVPLILLPNNVIPQE